MSEKLASLVVDMEMNTAALRSGVDQAKAALTSLGSSVGHIAEQLRGLSEMKGFEIGKEVIEKLGEFVLRGNEVAAQMGKMAQAAGVPVAEFSRLAYAASLSGISTEDLGVAFKKLDVNLAKAGAGSKDQVALFGAMGIAVKDASGKVRGGADVMNDLATKFAGLEDGASKTALAVEIFGKAGAAMIPMLNQGAAGLAKASAEADRFGITLSEGAVKSAEEFEQNLKRLEVATSRVGTRVAAELAPALANLTGELLNSKDGADALKGASEVLATALKLLVSGGILVGAVFETVGTDVALVANAITEVAKGNFGAALSLQQDFQTTAEASASKAADRISAIWSGGTGATDALKRQDEAAKKSADAIQAAYERMKKASAEAETAFKSLTATLEGLQTQAAEGASDDWVDKMNAKLDTGKIADELKKIGKAGEEMRDKLVAAFTDIHDQAALKLSLKADFDIARGAAATSAGVGLRQADFNGTAVPTAGFASFNAALETFAKETDHHARLLATAEQLQADGYTAAAQRTLLFADESLRSANEASKAADAFAAASKDAKAKLFSAIESFASSFNSKMGELGSIIQSGFAGFKSGGVWGAIGAVLIEIFSKFQRFQELVDFGTDQLSAFIGQLKNGLGALVDGLKPLMGVLGVLSQIIGSLLVPLFKSLGYAFGIIGQVLTPAIGLIRTALEPIGEIANGLIDMGKSLPGLAEVVKGIAVAFNFVSLTIMGVINGIQRAWGWILGAVIDFLKAIGADYTDVKKLQTSNQANIDAGEQKMKNLWANITDANANANAPHAGESGAPTQSGGYGNTANPYANTPAGKAIANLGDAAADSAKKISKMTEALTNIPQGFKTALRSFQAMNPADQAQSGRFANGGPPTEVHVHVAGGVMTTVDSLVKVIGDALSKKQFQRTGLSKGTT